MVLLVWVAGRMEEGLKHGSGGGSSGVVAVLEARRRVASLVVATGRMEDMAIVGSRKRRT